MTATGQVLCPKRLLWASESDKMMIKQDEAPTSVAAHQPRRAGRRWYFLRRPPLGLLLLLLLLVTLSAVSNLGAPTYSQMMERLGASEKVRLAKAIHLRQTP